METKRFEGLEETSTEVKRYLVFENIGYEEFRMFYKSFIMYCLEKISRRYWCQLIEKSAHVVSQTV